MRGLGMASVAVVCLLAGCADPSPTTPPGKPLPVEVVVENVGSSLAWVTLWLDADGVRVHARNGTLSPGETAILDVLATGERNEVQALFGTEAEAGTASTKVVRRDACAAGDVLRMRARGLVDERPGSTRTAAEWVSVACIGLDNRTAYAPRA